jgi:hypothetical protein
VTKAWKACAKKWRSIVKQVDAECAQAHECELAAIRTSRATAQRLKDAEAVIEAARAWKESAYGLKADDDLFRAVIAYDKKHGGGG